VVPFVLVVLSAAVNKATVDERQTSMTADDCYAEQREVDYIFMAPALGLLFVSRVRGRRPSSSR